MEFRSNSEYQSKYINITGNQSVVIKSGAGVLRTLIINNNSSGGTISAYDGLDANGTRIFAMQVGTASGGVLSTSGIPGPAIMGPLDIPFEIGLTLVTSGSNANNVSIVYF